MQVKTLYAIGGQQKRLGHQQSSLRAYHKALIVKLDLESSRLESCLEYVTPPEFRPDEKSEILFKAGTFQDNKFYVCTTTEILIYALPHFERIGYVTLPRFNDVHHVCPTPAGNLLVAVTGLDMVVEVTPQGQILREWNVLGQELWERFSQEVDYRKILTTKPHHSHPNFVFQEGEDIWVTRFEQKDAICLTRPERRIDVGVERLHDGVVYKNKVYFTAVDGHIIIANLENHRIEQVINLNEITVVKDRALGWCRGLEVIDEDHVVVGFSRLRPTKFRENLRWVKRRFGNKATGNASTRISLLNLREKKICWDQSLEDAGMNAVFSIHAA